MKILVLGGTSLIARYFIREAKKEFQLEFLQRKLWNEIDPNLNSFTVIQTSDLPTETTLRELIPKYDWIINFISDGRVNYCEEHPEQTRTINLEFPLMVAKICENFDVRYCCFSSNVVFDGSEAPYDEISVLTPVGVYGRQKAELETTILDIYPKTLLVRTLFTYGIPFKVNFRSNPVYDLLLNKPTQPVKAVNDIWNNPIYSKDIATFLTLAISKNLSGLFNVAGFERLSRYDLFSLIFDLKKYDKHLLLVAKDSDFPGPSRPKDTTFDISKSLKTGWQPTSTQKALEEMLLEISSC